MDLLTDNEAADILGEVDSFLDQLATVYGEHATTGAYTVVLKTNLRCRVNPVNTMAPASGGARVELMAARDFFWDGSYLMPENVQVVVDGTTYQAEAGTYTPVRVDSTTILYRKCSVVRVQVTGF